MYFAALVALAALLAARQIRAERAFRRVQAQFDHDIRTPMNGIVGITALLLDTDLTAEQREYVTDLQRSANQLLAVSAGRPTTCTSPLTRSSDSQHVLIADDNAINRKVAVRLVEKLGHRAEAVCDGAQAVEALQRRSYALVLMDCQMPLMDGFEATSHIRHNGNGQSRVPIIAMTAQCMESDRTRCLEAGMDDFVSKPVTPTQLAAVLERWLPRP